MASHLQSSWSTFLTFPVTEFFLSLSYFPRLSLAHSFFSFSTGQLIKKTILWVYCSHLPLLSQRKHFFSIRARKAEHRLRWDTESTQFCWHALDEICSAGETLFRGVWMITENKCYEQKQERVLLLCSYHAVTKWMMEVTWTELVIDRKPWREFTTWNLLQGIYGKAEGNWNVWQKWWDPTGRNDGIQQSVD